MTNDALIAYQPLAIVGGHVVFKAEADAPGSATLRVAGVGAGRVTWSATTAGAQATCGPFELDRGSAAVFGVVIDRTGERVIGGDFADKEVDGSGRPLDFEYTFVIGCGAAALVGVNGDFFSYVDSGECELRAQRRNGWHSAEGDSIELDLEPGSEVFDLVLVAPDVPAWHGSAGLDPTAD